MFLLPKHKFRVSFYFFLASLCSTEFCVGGTINEALIETALLLNLTSHNNIAQATSRRYSQSYSNIDDNMSEEIDTLLNEVNTGEEIDTIELAFVNILTNYTNENKVDAVEYAFNYLAQNKNIFNLSDEKLLSAIQSIFASLIKTSSMQDLEISFEELPLRTFKNLIPQPVKSWGGNASDWAELLSGVFIDSITYSALPALNKKTLQELTIKSTITGVLKLVREGEENSDGFTPGIEQITDSSTNNEIMEFGGPYPQFKKFNSSKTDIVHKATSGLANAIFKNINDTNDIRLEFDKYSNILGNNAIEGVYEFLNSLEGEDHSIFAYELSRVIANSLSYNSVLVSTSFKNFDQISLPSYVAEIIAKSVASKSIENALKSNLTYDLGLIAQSVSFGSAQGSQLASISEKSLDYPDNWEVFSRKEIAKKSSEGSSSGAVNTAAKMYLSPDQYEGTEKPPENTNWKDILSIAQGTSMGSLTANTAMSIYFPTEQQSIINYAAHGSTYGSVSANNLNTILPEPQNPTSEIKVDVARASAIGATTAATFEIVALLDAKPHLNSNDIDTLKTIEAATYGTTFGAIQAGAESLNSDAVQLKQATKQGATSGTLNGIGLGLGRELNVAAEIDLKSKASILQTITNTNSVASTNASRSIATKSIKTSSSDMLLLMRKFNISPKFTNPTRIYKDTKSEIDSSASPSVESTIEFASPI